MASHLIDVTQLQTAIRLVVRGFGSHEAEVEAVAANLIEANLTGHDSHGIGMMPRYVEAYQQHGLVPNQHVRTVLDAGTLLRLDGGAGFGQVIGREALELGIARALQHGSCEPVILDFATSMMAQGKTRVAFNKGELVPPGCLLDDQGRPTREPRYAVNPPFGALLAFGEHKGYGLALLCELLGGALAAGMTQHSEDVTRRRVLNGMLTVLIDPAALADRAAFERETLAFIDWVKASPAREGFDSVRIAGEPERETRAQRTTHGVPVDSITWNEILDAAGKLGLEPKMVNAAAGQDERARR